MVGDGGRAALASAGRGVDTGGVALVDDPLDRVELTGSYRDDETYPALVFNTTNRCNLSCRHCFVYRDANPNEAISPRLELSDDEMCALLAALRDRHQVHTILWMGGEPLLRRSLLERGSALFAKNHVVTNGTLPLVDLGSDALYIVSVDGPPEVNDGIRGEGTFARVMKNLERVPDGFRTPIQAQCTVTRANEHRLAELVEMLVASRFEWMTFSFYVPPAEGDSPDAWASNEERMGAVREVMRLKEQYPGFVRNRTRALELMAPELAPTVTADCPARRFILPLYGEDGRYTTPYCCYGNDVDCDRCGAWVVFMLAAGLEPSGSAPR